MDALKVLMGEWLPDLPDLDNPGLTEAHNVIPSDGGYRPFRPMSALSDAIPFFSAPAGVFTTSAIGFPTAAYIPVTSGTNLENISESVYVGTNDQIYRRTLATGTADWVTVGATGAYAFAQYDNLIIGINYTQGSSPKVATLSSSSTFTTLATSGTLNEGCDVIGVVGKFVVIGWLNSAADGVRPTLIRWSAIDEPRNWPVPGTSTATATQAGEQYMPYELGRVTGIFGTDQYGIVLQAGGISRMQYIGGTVVFQFDKIESTVGSIYRNGAVMVGGIVYFASSAGFFSTDGVSVKQIGNSKVTKFFLKAVNEGGVISLVTSPQFYDTVRCAYDRINDVIYWAHKDSSIYSTVSVYPTNRILAYHRSTGRWSRADENCLALVGPSPGTRNMLHTSTSTASADVDVADIYGINYSGRFCRFSGSPGTATIETAEQELLPGKYSHVDGVKPLIEYTSTAPAISVSIGSRNDQSDASLTFSGTTTPTTDTGFADFRDSARYHRVKVQITGEFEKATGLEVKVLPEGER